MFHKDGRTYSNSALSFMIFLTKSNMNVVSYPPYLPDLAHCDFALFPKLKIELKDCWFERIEMIQENQHTAYNRYHKKYCKISMHPLSCMKLCTLTHQTWYDYHLSYQYYDYCLDGSTSTENFGKHLLCRHRTGKL